MAWLALFHFDDTDTSTAVDVSGNGYDIDLTGLGSQVDSAGVLDDGALSKTDSGTIPLPAGLLAASETDDRSVMVDGAAQRTTWWVRWESASLDTGVFGLLSLDGGATITTRARDQGNSSPSGANTVGALEDGERHNYALTYQRSTGVLSRYYDGALVGAQAFAPGTALYVGADGLNIAEWASAGAALDNLRIADHCADATEIAALAGAPVTAGPAPVDEITGTLPVELGMGGTLDAPAATVAELAGTVPVAISVTGVLDAPAATVPELSATLAVELDLAGVLTAPTPAVGELTATLPVSVTIGGVLDAPAATVGELAGALSTVVDLGGVLLTPATSIPELAGPIAVDLAVGGELATVTAVVPHLVGGIHLQLVLEGTLDNGETPVTVGGSGLNTKGITAGFESLIAALGHFETTNGGGDPESVVGNGLHCRHWPQVIEPVAEASGLGAVSVRLELKVRIYGAVQSLPRDEIDEDLLDAVDAICNAFAGGFTIDGQVRNVDIYGAHGLKMRGDAGYLDVQEGTCRVLTITLPMIINDVWILEG
ncbi:MAG TPA: hypothetical protein VGP26_24570 [Actinophytocola sp.]|nr:hypothetical protein [Actinophytocola sp.]